LRVALRRCRSLADGLMAIDSDPNWKAMKKAGKRLFQRLGDLRDIQIMMEWIEKLEQIPASVEPSMSSSPAPQNSQSAASASDPLSDPDSSPADALLKILKGREAEQK